MAIERQNEKVGHVPPKEIIRLLKWRNKPSFWQKATTIMEKYKVNKNYVNGLLKKPMHGR